MLLHSSFCHGPFSAIAVNESVLQTHCRSMGDGS